MTKAKAIEMTEKLISWMAAHDGNEPCIGSLDPEESALAKFLKDMRIAKVKHEAGMDKKMEIADGVFEEAMDLMWEKRNAFDVEEALSVRGDTLVVNPVALAQQSFEARMQAVAEVAEKNDFDHLTALELYEEIVQFEIQNSPESKEQ